jgi:hypothetical protein
MKKYLLLLCLFLSFDGFGQKLVSEKSGKISFGEKIKYLSEIDSTLTYGDEVNLKYWFVNKGDAPLKILDIKTTCSCTSPDYSSDNVLPLDSGYIQLSTTYDQLMAIGSVNAVIISNTRTKYQKIVLSIGRNNE